MTGKTYPLRQLKWWPPAGDCHRPRPGAPNVTLLARTTNADHWRSSPCRGSKTSDTDAKCSKTSGRTRRATELKFRATLDGSFFVSQQLGFGCDGSLAGYAEPKRRQKKQCREMEWQREAETKRDRDKESGHTDGLLRFEAIEQLKIETAEHTLMDRRLSQRGAARRRSYASVPLGYWLISVGPMAAALTAHPGEASIVLGHAQQATVVVPRLRLR